MKIEFTNCCSDGGTHVVGADMSSFFVKFYITDVLACVAAIGEDVVHSTCDGFDWASVFVTEGVVMNSLAHGAIFLVCNLERA